MMVFVGVAAPSNAQINFVRNGSFETSSVIDTNIGAGSTAIVGWTVGGTAVTVQDSAFIVLAKDGARYLDLSSLCDLRCIPAGSYGSVGQTLATIVGTTYELSFYGGSYSSNFAAPTLVASAGSLTHSYLLPLSTKQTGDWTLYSFDFTAVAPSTVISFAGAGGQVGATFLLGVDNIQVASVPEPATFPLMIIGLAAMGIASRWRIRRRVFRQCIAERGHAAVSSISRHLRNESQLPANSEDRAPSRLEWRLSGGEFWPSKVGSPIPSRFAPRPQNCLKADAACLVKLRRLHISLG